MTMIIANVLPDRSAGFIATDTRAMHPDGQHYVDCGGKIVKTPFGWGAVTSNHGPSCRELLLALRDTPADPTTHPLSHLARLCGTALNRMATAPSRSSDHSWPAPRLTSAVTLDETTRGAFLSRYEHEGTEAFEYELVVAAPHGYDPKKGAQRQEMIAREFQQAAPDLVTRIQTAARYFRLATGDSRVVSDRLHVGFFLMGSDGEMRRGFLDAPSAVIAVASSHGLLQRFCAPDPTHTVSEWVDRHVLQGVFPFTAFDAVAQEILSSLAIGQNVRGDSSVVFGSTLKYQTTRHTETISAVNTGAPAFSSSYEAIPRVDVFPSVFTLPGGSSTVDRKIEFKATDVTVSGCNIRAVWSTGSSTTARSENPSATLNGTTAATQTISANNGVAFWNLSGANTTLTTYHVTYDVDTTVMVDGQLQVAIYKNNGTTSTSWTQVASAIYDIGGTWSGEVLSFDAALAANWDIRILVSKVGGHVGFGATVTAKACTYDEITAGTENTLTPAGSSLTVQAVERS